MPSFAEFESAFLCCPTCSKRLKAPEHGAGRTDLRLIVLVLSFLTLNPSAARAADLFVSSTTTNVPGGPISQILRFDGTTGMPVGTGVFVPPSSAGLSLPSGLAFGPNGNLFVASSGSNQILQYDGMTGAPVGNGVFVPAGSAGLSGPSGIVFGPNGNLFVSSGNRVLEFNGTTGAPVGNGVFVSAGSAGLGNAIGLAFDPNGNLFVSDGNRVLEYDGTSGAPVGNGVFVAPASAGLSIALGLTFGPNGNLFVSDEGTLRVLEYDGTTGAPVGNGVFVSFNSAGLRNPYGLTFGPNGNLFVSSSATPEGGLPGNQVLEYDGTTGVPVGDGVFVSQGSAGLSQPSFLVFGPSVAAVPEPSTAALFVVGLASLAAWRRLWSGSGASSRGSVLRASRAAGSLTSRPAATRATSRSGRQSRTP
jgi:glucose/arabinose dehydrogenase